MFASWKHAILAADGNVGCFTMHIKKTIESEVISSVTSVFKHCKLDTAKAVEKNELTVNVYSCTVYISVNYEKQEKSFI